MEKQKDTIIKQIYVVSKHFPKKDLTHDIIHVIIYITQQLYNKTHKQTYKTDTRHTPITTELQNVTLSKKYFF